MKGIEVCVNITKDDIEALGCVLEETEDQTVITFITGLLKKTDEVSKRMIQEAACVIAANPFSQGSTL